MAFFCSGVRPLFTIAATEGRRSRRFAADALGALRFGAIAAREASCADDRRDARVRFVFAFDAC